jgi:hypothetical protein
VPSCRYGERDDEDDCADQTWVIFVEFITFRDSHHVDTRVQMVERIVEIGMKLFSSEEAWELGRSLV